MKCTPPSIRRAFSLIEVTIALAILSILIGMVAVIAYNTMTMSTQLVASQRDEMRTQAFLDWVRRSFGNLPGNALWQIVGEPGQTSSSSQLADMVLQDVPLMLHWSDTPLQIKALRLRTLKQDNGFLKLVLECYDEEILDQAGNADSLALLDVKPVATTVLLEDVRWCEWMVRNPRTDEWSETLSRLDPRPYQLELNLAFGADGQNIREVFWVPPKQNPKILVQEFMSSRSGSRRGGGGNGNHTQPPEGGAPPSKPPQGGGSEGGGSPPALVPGISGVKSVSRGETLSPFTSSFLLFLEKRGGAESQGQKNLVQTSRKEGSLFYS